MSGIVYAVAAALGALLGVRFGAADGHGAFVAAAIALVASALTRDSRARVGALSLVLGCAGMAAMQRSLDGLEHSAIPDHGAGVVRGVLVGDPDTANHSTRVLVRVDHIDGEAIRTRQVFVRASGDVGDRLALLEAGDGVELSGTFGPLSGFDARRRWEHAVVMLRAERIIGARESVSLWWRSANVMRAVMVRGAGPLPATERALMMGFLFGDTRALPADVTNDFRAAGLSHLLAVSGANLAFLFGGLEPLLRRLGHRARIGMIVAVVLAFGAMTRWEPSVLRASAMVGVTVLARFLGRPHESARVLGLATAALVIADPFLIARIGFLLSVGACIGLVFVTPRLAARIPGPEWIAEPIATTGGAIVGTAPVQLAVFGTVPLIAVPANLLAGASAALLTVWGFGASAVGGMLPALGSLVQIPSLLLLRAQLAIAHAAAALPLAIDARAVAAACGFAAALRAVHQRMRAGTPGP